MLQKQLINLAFQGVDTKTDSKTLPLGKLVQLVNADITNQPTVAKRKVSHQIHNGKNK
jgi:hypothetical protein